MSESPAAFQPQLLRYQRRLALGELSQPRAITALCAVSCAVAATVGTTLNTSADTAYTSETIAPLLAAFLAAGCLSPELQSGALGLAAYRSGFTIRVVLARVLAIIIASLAVVGLTLTALSSFVMGTPLPLAMAAAFPSAWALSMVALVFATRFRSPAWGFGVAAGLWGLNVALGHGVHPLLGLQGLFAKQDGELSASHWLLGKLALLAVGFVLLRVQRRDAERAHLKQPGLMAAAAAAALTLGLYTLSGAALVVGIAWLDQPVGSSHLGWLQARMRPLQPTGIPALFGPAFQAYISGGPEHEVSKLEMADRMQQLEAAAARWPRSIWADEMVLGAGELRHRLDQPAAIRAYLELAERRPRSRVGLKALHRILVLEGASQPTAVYGLHGSSAGFAAARKLLEEYPNSAEAAAAQRYLETRHE